MPSLLHISMTLGQEFEPGGLPLQRPFDVAHALAGDGVLEDGWAIDMPKPTPDGWRAYTVALRGSDFARGWLCLTAAAHPLAWRRLVVEHGRPKVAEPLRGPWLLTAQLADGARFTADNPALRNHARGLLRDIAWHEIMASGATDWNRR